MRVASNWKDFEVIDTSSGEKLERWGDVILARPDPQIIWNTQKGADWKKANARYQRSSSGGGQWDNKSMDKDQWHINYGPLTFKISPTNFKHTGLFPEQAVNWDFMADKIRNAGRPISVLNLFAYTGGATVACLSAGAAVTHVDASKGMVQWAKENAASSGVADRSVRWIVDDCMKFVAREIRRGNKYDIIIMDPPSYGRGPGGEVWKLENEIYGFVNQWCELLTDNSLAVLINSYTAGVSPAVMSYILNSTVAKRFGGFATADEIGLKVTDSGLVLPCGSTAVWKK